MNRNILVLLAALAALALPPAVRAHDQAPDLTVDGLQRVEDSELGLVYVRPGAPLGSYRRILLGDVTVAFRKNWLRNQNQGRGADRIRPADVERIKSELAELFREVFVEELEAGGAWEVTDEVGDDVLRLDPEIVNLDITAPDVPSAGRSYMFSESAGEMTLQLEAYDSVSGELLARAVDRRRDRETGQFEWRSRVSNRADAKRILSLWARLLRDGLDRARASESAAE